MKQYAILNLNNIKIKIKNIAKIGEFIKNICYIDTKKIIKIKNGR